MHTKLKLSHDEMVVLAVIADQELMHSEIEDELFRLGLYDEAAGEFNLKGMIKKGLLTSNWKWVLYYAIAPEILSLNHSPYSYGSWRALSE